MWLFFLWGSINISADFTTLTLALNSQSVVLTDAYKDKDYTLKHKDQDLADKDKDLIHMKILKKYGNSSSTTITSQW